MDYSRSSQDTAYKCNPELVIPFAPANKYDLCLLAFSHHFQYGLAPPVSRPGSSASMQTNTLTASSFTATRRRVKVPKEEQGFGTDFLFGEMICIDNEARQYFIQSRLSFLLSSWMLSSRRVHIFLQEQTLTSHFLRKLVPWGFCNRIGPGRSFFNYQ